jgi:hypothetical protein
MNSTQCDREQEVLEAAQIGRWRKRLDDSLSMHIAQCPVCAEVALVAQFLQREDELASVEAALPEAGLVWWKAQLLARRAAAERAAQPIAIVERVACASAVLSLVALVIWQWSRIQGWLSELSDLWNVCDLQLREFFVSPWNGQAYILMVSAGGLLLVMAFLVYSALAEE